ncbi:MAG: hypothetical protein AVDCRST_MAG73-3070 [uncultured Thermomicrobiales bacterium]|uniref:ParE-like toxin domain-containing protein n=1 Tax=uncultured Thermomicrobiales bacterium TaxID=1645740 RepID=A0A6J4UMX6_9BACT|nr:MAG: hypothetical protein AVDCRST_MAG73-3070 [uncultured Thermomicrobiales bacterium]
MKSRTTEQFQELLAALPASIQRRAHDAYRLFQDDPFHPPLQFWRINPRDPTVYSARVGRRYRVIGIRNDDDVLWLWIGSHAEYDRIGDRF